MAPCVLLSRGCVCAGLCVCGLRGCRWCCSPAAAAEPGRRLCVSLPAHKVPSRSAAVSPESHIIPSGRRRSLRRRVLSCCRPDPPPTFKTQVPEALRKTRTRGQARAPGRCLSTGLLCMCVRCVIIQPPPPPPPAPPAPAAPPQGSTVKFAANPEPCGADGGSGRVSLTHSPLELSQKAVRGVRAPADLLPLSSSLSLSLWSGLLGTNRQDDVKLQQQHLLPVSK